MSKIWGYLGKSRLQELIGSDVLSKLEIILPALLRDSSVSRPEDIYSKENLVKIFDAFSGTNFLKKKEFRREFFHALPVTIVNKIIYACDPEKVSDGFEQKKEFLTSSWSSDSPITHKIIEILKLPHFAIPYKSKKYRSFEKIEPAENSYKSLKDYQSSVFHDSFKKLNIPRSRFIIQMPTGSGKTRTAMEIITSFLNESDDGTIVVWLAHSGELCEQAYEAFREIWHHVAKKPLMLISAWGNNAGSLDANFDESVFLIGGFQKLYSILEKTDQDTISRLKSKTGLIVIDEAHKVLAPTYEYVTKQLLGDETCIIGLTATPGRSVTDTDENKKLAEFFFGGKVAIDAGEDSPIEYLRDKGVLSKVERRLLITNRSFSLTSRQIKHLETRFDFSPEFLRVIGSDEIRNLEIVESLKSECKRQSQIIFFGCSVDHSKFICALLIFLGIKAAHIDGETPNSRRSDIIENFRKGNIQVVCNYGVLSTGFDAPKTDVVFISRPTTSIVLYSQMIGRGFRGPEIGGTERCKIIDVIDNIEGFSDEKKVYDYFEKYYQ